MAENWEILGQLFLAMVLAGFLGLERVLAGKVAGLRTFALVSMGSALLVIVSEQVSQRYLGLVGFKLYVIAIFAALLTLFVFTAMWFFESKAKKVMEDIED